MTNHANGYWACFHLSRDFFFIYFFLRLTELWIKVRKNILQVGVLYILPHCLQVWIGFPGQRLMLFGGTTTWKSSKTFPTRLEDQRNTCSVQNLARGPWVWHMWLWFIWNKKPWGDLYHPHIITDSCFVNQTNSFSGSEPYLLANIFLAVCKIVLSCDPGEIFSDEQPGGVSDNGPQRRGLSGQLHREVAGRGRHLSLPQQLQRRAGDHLCSQPQRHLQAEENLG